MSNKAPHKPEPRSRGKRINIYAGEPMERVLTGHDKNRSGRINAICERYLAIVADACPTWTLAQWSAVCDALNGTFLLKESGIRFAWAEIADADQLNGLGEKWEVDAQEISAEMRDLSYAGKVAVIEVVERFWQRCELPTEVALRQAGAKIKD